jgi:hypothetical protein
VLMLQDLEQLFRKSWSLLSKFGFPTPIRVPTEIEEVIFEMVQWRWNGKTRRAVSKPKFELSK